MFSIEIGANPEIVDMNNLVDMDERPVKGLGLVNYDNRLWIFKGNILWYSVQENIYDFHTSDYKVKTSSGFNEYIKNITAITPYLGSLAIFFKDSSILLSGEYPYTQTDESPGGCASYNSLVFHGTELYFYDDTKKGVFSFNQVVNGDKTLGSNIALDIQQELCEINPTRLNDIRVLSIVLSDRNEIWFLIPTTEPDITTIMIFDYVHKEWVKRKCPDVTCFNIINNSLYSGGLSGKIYEEYKTDTFNGTFIRSFYKCTPLNLGVDNTLKILYFPPRITADMTYSGDFWVRYIKNYDMFGTEEGPGISTMPEDFNPFDIFEQFFQDFGGVGGFPRGNRGGTTFSFNNGTGSFTVFSSGFGNPFFSANDEDDNNDENFINPFDEIFFGRSRTRERNNRNSGNSSNRNNNRNSRYNRTNREEMRKRMENRINNASLCLQFFPLFCFIFTFIILPWIFRSIFS